ncbi:DNA-(apurinic or apyrimidinic site) endonuclease 2-like [Argiope bruennichi]|uniref:DNA-(apurinic or apyrimidinic site) endonuclease 2-like n=1 Tax=Argiope bruennichi TaxID=94029 RepID=UPI0024945AFA|nr:DNA-(apurinic or apyrimidinic site) endonuclease 2-like [Argiope bruennichi]
MKIVTWNVNGIRSLKKSVDCVLKELSADVACFQETKVSRGQIPETTALIDGYTSYFSYPRKQSGYSGVASYCKDTYVPEDAEEGLCSSNISENYSSLTDVLSFSEVFPDSDVKFDPEGRIIITYHLIKYEDEIQRLAVINIYCPRVDPEKPERFLYKMQFCLLLEAKVKELCRTGCSVIILGDFNIACSIIDHCDPGDETEFNSSKFRQWLKALLFPEISLCDEKVRIVDTFRHFYPDKKESYTCWNTKTGARATNYGTRIDYILVTSNLLPLLESCEIMSDYHGSDHCPVSAILKCDSISQKNVRLPSICTRLWPEFSGQQQKLQAFFKKTQNLADFLTKEKETNSQTVSCVNKSAVKKNKQKSITSFFKSPSSVPSASVCDAQSDNSVSETSSLSSSPSDMSSSSKSQESNNENDDDKVLSLTKKNQSAVWKTMLAGPPKPPLCSGHQKECVLRNVKKKGPNYGRNFFMCSYPTGHPSNPEANCNFFKWVTAPKVNSLKKV